MISQRIVEAEEIDTEHEGNTTMEGYYNEN
jgi:hypothetical protein